MITTSYRYKAYNARWQWAACGGVVMDPVLRDAQFLPCRKYVICPEEKGWEKKGVEKELSLAESSSYNN